LQIAAGIKHMVYKCKPYFYDTCTSVFHTAA
jgi:hypothetical protein